MDFDDIWKRDFERVRQELLLSVPGVVAILDFTEGKTPFIQQVVDLARREKGLASIDVWE